MKNIEIIGGGTVFHIRNHLALTAPAYGKTAKYIHDLCLTHDAWYSKGKYKINLHLTKMAGGSSLETNEDVSKLLDTLISDNETKIVFFNPAIVDYEGTVTENALVPDRIGYYSEDRPTTSGKYETRLKTSAGPQKLLLTPAPKLLRKIRQERKDIFLVAFKTTCGATEDEQFLTGLHLLKTASCNLVLANDTKTRKNMIITPEQARYSVTTNRSEAIAELVAMAVARSEGHFTRSTVVEGDAIPWNSHLIPTSLRVVVDHCIQKGAYKPFNGSTVGHFAVKVNKTDFITSKRKADFNKLKNVGMVLCRAEGDEDVIAYGAKPSVGGQSQRIVFAEHPEMDCIVHFHCPMKFPAELSVRSQREHECGSHECGQNTSRGLREEVAGIKCVYLDNHGPNIVFNRNIHPYQVIEFIEKNFDLSKSTDQVNRETTDVLSLQ
jgi:hypothetical protein